MLVMIMMNKLLMVNYSIVTQAAMLVLNKNDSGFRTSRAGAEVLTRRL